MLTTSIILSASRADGSFDDALRAIVTQEAPAAECLIVARDTPSNRTLGEHVSAPARVLFYDTPQTETDALNSAFAQTRGAIMAWLGDGDMLCPWALSVAATIFARRADVEWLTSVVPIQWSASRFLVPDKLADGFSRDTFFQGRNLKTSPYFHHPLARVGTFWRRELWERSGGFVRAPLHAAGDFELWTRFWNSAALVSVRMPLGGRLAECADDAPTYWRAAEQFLHAHAQHTASFRGKLQRRLMRRIPRLKARWGSPALFVSFAAQGKQCVMQSQRLA
jgi:hypothetical protein